MTFSKKNLALSNSIPQRKALLDSEEPKIPLTRQAQLLGVNRTSYYRAFQGKTIAVETVGLMHRIDVLYTRYPFYGYRRMTAALRQEGEQVNHKRVRRLMRSMGIEAIYPGPNLSKHYHAQYCRPYLLRKLAINRTDQVWGIDITYIRMGKGFMYLFVVFASI